MLTKVKPANRKQPPIPVAVRPHPTPVLNPEEIRVRAYGKYCARDGSPGDALSDWLEAERELREIVCDAEAATHQKREAVLLSATEPDGDPAC